MDNKRYYRYIIELDAPMWPRKLADDLSFARDIYPRLLSVTDLQNDAHIYGATYRVRPADDGQNAAPRRGDGPR